MVEYVIRSGDPLVKDALSYISSSPDFFGLFKVLEVIGWDVGKGSQSKGYRLIRKLGWASKKELKDFRLGARPEEKRRLETRVRLIHELLAA